MKRIPQTLGQHLAPVKLYLDDIEKLAEIVAAVPSKLELSTADYELEQPQQLLELKRPAVDELKIGCRDPYVVAHVKDSSVWLYAARDDAVSRGIYEQMREVLRRRRRLVVWALAGPQGGMISGCLVGAGIVGAVAGVRLRSAWLDGVGLGFLAVGVLAILSSFRYLSGANLIVLSNRRDSPSFMARNRDQLAIAVVAALIGAGAGAFATYLLTR